MFDPIADNGNREPYRRMVVRPYAPGGSIRTVMMSVPWYC